MRKLTLAVIITFTLSLAVRIAWGAEDTDNFREDVFACEDAVSYLASCCPDFVPDRVRCVYSRHRSDGCDSYTVYKEDPAVSVGEASCVLALDCPSLRDKGVCERAARMQPERSSYRKEAASSPSGHESESNPEVLCQ